MKTEKLSFFNPSAVSLPEGVDPIVRVFEEESVLKYERLSGAVEPIGQIELDEPQSFVGTSVEPMTGDVIIALDSDQSINLGPLPGGNTYTLPSMQGSGLHLGSGDFTELVSETASIQLTETADEIVVSSDESADYSTSTYSSVRVRLDTSAMGIRTPVEHTFNPPNNTWVGIELNHVDYDDIGLTLTQENELVLPAGLYYIEMDTNVFRGGMSLELTDKETGWTVLKGQSVLSYATNSNSSSSVSLASGYVKLLKETTLFVRAFFTSTGTSSRIGLMYAGDIWGDYIDLFSIDLWKVQDTGGSFPTPTNRTLINDVMSSNSSAGQVASASSSFDSRFLPWNAFARFSGGAVSDCWITNSRPSLSNPQWIQLVFNDAPRTFNGYLLINRSATVAVQSPRDWVLEGRDEDTDDWTVIHTVVGSPGARVGGYREFKEIGTHTYRQLRMTITAINSTHTSNYVCIQALDFFLDSPVELD